MPELNPADLTDAHRDQARRALLAGGYPWSSTNPAARAGVLEAIATAIALALAEERGTDSITGEYCSGCGAHADEPNDVERRDGCTTCLGDAPIARDDDYTPAAVDRSDEDDHGAEEHARLVADYEARQSADAERAAARAERMSWSPGDLVITPPPPPDGDQ
jgi:hypothetical protein